ncbi:PE-PPE domain-containing protein OS=Tsukamurella paurometabola (strain ATCC 8368 / DSM / CCUG 35730 / CIP 100753 / JCM 10117 / KCTC 9821 / NBRC 16120 /NCIMB 702349 / NCTC 13040) OX=521096 GN=Tpau_2904 PE=4 SV=1 [Tsukamurella paurometabola]|uniref:Uncharacterized protein n=1 Tax=Tsukamurella paurometabola (strain ATCC 8368 / DSM 20162 / CCUG 35730 / CIP 100753 / JCM 10117 / KCTC 9821 / NBRC 16120 / NCIMB 702349 / NCTC 13040) TaxID=521096 RepID=D5UTZ9_TSUPD|nr:hypothetical protein [Tsukamurella paurometabola]ADG79502.1 hypothetical protein Tpau_2904 [Tsukamurella paurometabola DSM 20162]SUP35998.1 Ribonucleases G and E [Tsukamurella paurometabola]
MSIEFERPSTPAPENRAARRRSRVPRRRSARRHTAAWRGGFAAVAATATLMGTAAAPMALAADTAGQPFDITIGGTSLRDVGIDITKLNLSNPDLSGIDFQKVLGLLDNPAISKIVESCRTGALGSGGGGSNVDCAGATGTGAAVVLPDRLDLAAIADQVTIDLGPRVGALGVYVPMGVQTPFGVLSVLAVPPTGLVSLGLGALGIKDIDPTAMGKYKTLDDVKNGAALPVNLVQERYCDKITCIFGGWKYRDVDSNLGARTEALKIAGQLSGRTYDFTKPTVLDPQILVRGTSTILGDGFTFAFSRNAGTALAETKNKLALALAGADGADAASKAYANLGLALALNMNTSTMGLDWFGSPLAFDKIKDSQVIDKVLNLAKTFNMLPAGMNLDAATINNAMDTIQKLKLPDVKEVSCLGVGTSASASGLGECGNYLGTFDYYKDLRKTVDGQSRQTQWGLTDPTSLVLGQGNALSQVLTPGVLQLLTAVAGGDLSKVPFNELTGLLENPFVKDSIAALLSEEKRLKLTKDFVRFTKDVKTTETSHPVVDENGVPVLGPDGKPQVQTSSTSKTSYLLTSDYGLRSPITVDWLGYRLTVFPTAEVNGTVRPNYLGLPTITKIADGTPSLLPRIGLIELDNPFGLGTLPILPFDPLGAFSSWTKSITLKDDVNRIREVLPAVTAALPKTPAPKTETDGAVPVTAVAAGASASDVTAVASEPRAGRSPRSVAEAPAEATTAPTAETSTTSTPQPEKPTKETTSQTPTTESKPETTPAPTTESATAADASSTTTDKATSADAASTEKGAA